MIGGSGELALDISEAEGDDSIVVVRGALPSSTLGASKAGIFYYALMKSNNVWIIEQLQG